MHAFEDEHRPFGSPSCSQGTASNKPCKPQGTRRGRSSTSPSSRNSTILAVDPPGPRYFVDLSCCTGFNGQAIHSEIDLGEEAQAQPNGKSEFRTGQRFLTILRISYYSSWLEIQILIPNFPGRNLEIKHQISTPRGR